MGIIKNEIAVKFKYYVLIIFSKLFNKYNITICFENRIGIKNINKDDLKNKEYKIERLKEVDPKKICIGFDGMNDNYTLVGTPIYASPHFELMKCIKDNKDIKTTDYYSRSLKGALDERTSTYIGKKETRKMIDKYYQRKNEFTNLKIKPVKVYKLNGNLHVIDGKHRVALACLLNRTVTCDVVDNQYIIEGYWFMLYSKMLNNPLEFRKNIEFIESIIFT